MKKLLLIVLVLISYSVQAQRWGMEFGVNYVYVRPVGNMGNIIQQGHGATINYGWVTPNQRFAFGMDLSIAQYGHDKSRQQYTFSDGTVVPMDVIVSNTFANVMTYARWYLATEGPLRPYLTGKLGYSGFNTELNIYDPDELDHCKPVDNDVLYEDGTFIAVAGAGLKFDMSSVFKKFRENRFYLECSFNFTQGGNVRYMNADAHQHHTTPGRDLVMAEFVNTQTQIVHEHHVGNLYTSPVQMTELRFGFSMNISK